MLLQVWRMAMRGDAFDTQQIELEADVKQKMANQNKGAALRQLNLIVVRLVKGEVAMRVEGWRMAMTMDMVEQQQISAVASLQEQSLTPSIT